MSDPTTSNTTAKVVARTLQDALNDAVPIAEAAIIAAAPVMATPVLKEIWEEAFKISVQEIGSAIGKEGANILMDAQEYFHTINAASALTALKKAQAGGTPDELAKANAEADAAADALGQYHGDARL